MKPRVVSGNFDLQRVDTIAALATAPAPAALAVIRVSGPRAHSIREQIFRPRRGNQAFFVQTLGTIIHPASPREALDEAMCTAFPEPRSYTGEDSFELSTHGNPALVRRVLGVLETLGCRPAEPGEFTLRAFLSGRMDLSAAEAVHDLVKAQSERSARQALMHIQGGLRNVIQTLREAIVDVLAELEVRLDFPEEPLGDEVNQRVVETIISAEAKLSQLLGSASFGHRQREGARVVLLGRPNVGKSTLLNTLYGQERALVFDQPGTTRDVLEVELEIGGYQMVLVDVAGLRNPSEGDLDPVEMLGIARVQDELQQASCALFLRDEPRHHEEEDTAIRSGVPPHVTLIEVETKADKSRPSLDLAISAVSGEGIDELKRQLLKHLYGDSTDDVVLTRERHRVEVAHSRDAAQAAIHALQTHLPHEVVCGELRRACAALDALLGADVNEDVLDTIFRRFCIGK